MATEHEQERLIRLTLRTRALEALLEMPAEVPGELREVVQRGGVVVVVIAMPRDLFSAETAKTVRPDERPALRTQCQKDLLAALKALGASPVSRFTRPAIEAQLQKLGGEEWSESTVGAALAWMVKTGWLLNDHDHRGYGLPADLVSITRNMEMRSPPGS